MLKKTIKYVDYNGSERTEDFYFNYTKAELAEMQFSKEGGLGEWLDKIVKADDKVQIMKTFKEIILGAYGEKSDDGRRFVKSPEISKAFTQTEAYNQLFSELIEDDKKMSDFIHAVVPEGWNKPE